MKRFGFLKKPRSIDNTPYIRVYQVNKSLVNANVISFDITTNLTGGQTLNWEITGASAVEFTDNKGLSNTVVLAANGNATVTKTISTTPYAANGSVYGNTSFTFSLRAGGTTAGIVASNTAVIATQRDVSMIATGGTVTTNGNIKFHTFTSNGIFTITNTGRSDIGGPNTFIPDQYNAIIVGAGGGGGNVTGGTGAAGGGGAGGVTILSSVNAQLGNIAANIGTSASNANGSVTTFGLDGALGGGRGGSVPLSNTIVTAGVNGGGGAAFSCTVISAGSVGPSGFSGAPGGWTLATGIKGGGGSGANASAVTGNVNPTFGEGGRGYIWLDGIEYSKGGRGGRAPVLTLTTPGSGGIGGAAAVSPTGGAGYSGVVKIMYNYNTVPNRFLSIT